MIELNGRRLGVDDSIVNDYGAFHDGAALMDFGDRGRMRFLGEGARAALNGILTCDIAPLTDGQGTYGVALTNKGKVVADVVVSATGDSFVVETPVGVTTNWQQLVAKYINPRIARRVDESATSSAFGLFGPAAARLITSLAGVSDEQLDALAMYAHLTVEGVNVSRIPEMGVDGYRLLGSRETIDSLRAAAIAAGARAVSSDAAESVRIEAGRPVWGIDMDDNTIPQEANLDALNAISYTKGCYTGQEVVARLHFRGHVNKRLVGLRFDGAALPARGTPLTTGEGKECGDIRSSIVSPRFGPIALAMVRREVDAGAMVTVGTDGNEMRAEVVTLPFGG